MHVLLKRGLLFTLLVLFFVQCTTDENIIAEVGNLKITIAEYRKELRKSFPHQNLKEVSSEDKKAIMDRLIKFKKKVQAAYDLDLDEDEGILNAIKNQSDRMIANKYYERVIVDRLVTEKAINDYLEKQRKKNPTMDFSSDESDLQIIKQKLYQAYSDSARNLWRKHSQALKEKYSYNLQRENIDNIARIVNGHINDKKVTMDIFTQDQLETELATWNGGSIKLKDILKIHGINLKTVLPRVNNPKSIARDVDSQALLQIVLSDAKQYNIEDDKKIKADIRTALENMMVHLVEKKEIEEKAVSSEDDAFEYYQKHPEKFIKREEIEIWEIYVEDESLAKSLLKKAKTGQDFSKLAKTYSQDKSYASKGGYLGFRYIKGRGAVSQEAFKLGPGGKIGGPVKYRKGWVVFKTGKKNEESTKSFDSVKKLAENYVQNERIAENRVQWEKELNEKYPIKIYYDKLKEI